MEIVRAVLSLVVVAVFSWFYYYLDKLEKIGCECALTNTRTLLMVCIGAIIVLRLVDAFIPLPTLPQLLLSFVSVAFVFLAFTYVKRLKDEKCKCSENSARKAIDVYVWIVITIWILAALFLLALLFNVFIAAAFTTPQGNASNNVKLTRRK